MSQIFRINKGSVLPTLRMELINDAKYEFIKKRKFNNAIQNADITFSMKNEKGVLKISKAPVNLVYPQGGSCDDAYILEYKWKERDTKEEGKYEGWFEITFNNDIYEEGVSYPEGKLIMPITEKLLIYVQ